MASGSSSSIATRHSKATLRAIELLGKLIRADRIERRWSAQELGERVGVSRALIERIEHGDPRCGIGAAFEAATLVGISLFDAEPGRLGGHIADQNTKLRLLPKSARKKRVVVDDF